MLVTLAWIGLGASLIPAHRAAQRASQSVLYALVTVDVVAVAMCVVAAASARTWSSIAQEDGIVEWATVVSYVMAAGWLVIAVRKASPSPWFKVACFTLAAFCLVVAGEEISWGQRLFGFKPPDMFLERNFQQELNLHNVLMNERGLGFKIESKHLVMAVVLGFCTLWPWLVRRTRFAVFAPLAPPFAFAPLALGVVAAEMSYAVDLTGEGAELVAGMIFLASALVATSASPRAVVAWLIAPCAIGVVVSIVVAHVMFGSDEEGARVAVAELAVLKDDVVVGATDKLRKRNVHKRVFTSARDGYLQLSNRHFLEERGTPAEPLAHEPRHDRRGYFLDPWNNPYWLRYNKRTRSGTLYSFGPNRRRDDPGDDVIVRFSFGEAPNEDTVDIPPELTPQ